MENSKLFQLIAEASKEDYVSFSSLLEEIINERLQPGVDNKIVTHQQNLFVSRQANIEDSEEDSDE